MTSTSRHVAAALVPCLPMAFVACAPVQVATQAGYARLSVRGDLALADGVASTTEQSLRSAFGLGDARGAPFVRGQVDLGPLAVSASLMSLQESGAGVLSSDFGGLPAGTPVASDLDVAIGKLTGAFAIDLGPVTLSPGLQLDVFDLDFTARELVLGNREEIDELLALPLLFCRAEAELGGLRGSAEVGYLEIPSLDGNRGRFLDAEVALRWEVGSALDLVAGYRHLGIDAKGVSGEDTIVVDLVLSGWFVGGGLRF